MTRHVAITGAGGFVGGFAARWLAAQGFQITALSRQLQADLPRPGLAWRYADLRQPSALPTECDAIIHCAAELPSRTSDPAALYDLNRRMADAVFDHAARQGVGTVVFISSMSVYGAIDVAEVNESLAPRDPDPYGRAKRDGEDALAAAVARGAIASGLSIRLPGTVGQGSHHNFLSDALRTILTGGVVKAVNPDGLFNNIVYVEDLARFFADWIGTPKPGSFVTNLAARDPLPIRDVLAHMFSVAGKPLQCEFSPSPRKSFLISLRRAEELGYRPATVRDSVDAFVRSNLSGFSAP